MKRRARSGMVLALWVLSLVLAAVAVSLDAVGPSPKSPLGEVVALVVEVLAFTTAGALVASRRPESPIGWLLLAEGLVWELVAASTPTSATPWSPGRAPCPAGRWLPGS